MSGKRKRIRKTPRALRIRRRRGRDAGKRTKAKNVSALPTSGHMFSSALDEHAWLELETTRKGTALLTYAKIEAGSSVAAGRPWYEWFPEQMLAHYKHEALKFWTERLEPDILAWLREADREAEGARIGARKLMEQGCHRGAVKAYPFPRDKNALGVDEWRALDQKAVRRGRALKKQADMLAETFGTLEDFDLVFDANVGQQEAIGWATLYAHRLGTFAAQLNMAPMKDVLEAQRAGGEKSGETRRKKHLPVRELAIEFAAQFRGNPRNRAGFVQKQLALAGYDRSPPTIRGWLKEKKTKTK